MTGAIKIDQNGDLFTFTLRYDPATLTRLRDRMTSEFLDQGICRIGGFIFAVQLSTPEALGPIINAPIGAADGAIRSGGTGTKETDDGE